MENIANWWPGPDTVDIVGIDCYPKDNEVAASTAFSTCYDAFYIAYAAKYNIPFAIGETGYAGSAGAQTWLAQLVSQNMCQYPLFIAASWFEYNQVGGNFLIVEGGADTLKTQQILVQNPRSGCGGTTATIGNAFHFC